MHKETIVLGKNKESVRKSTADTRPTDYLVAPAAANELEPVRNATEKLTEGIMQRFASPDYVTLAMHVNLQTAKADLIPIPHTGNLLKLKDNFDRLPTKVQDVLKKNIPQEQMKAVEEIYEYLETKLVESGRVTVVEEGALEEKELQD